MAQVRAHQGWISPESQTAETRDTRTRGNAGSGIDVALCNITQQDYSTKGKHKRSCKEDVNSYPRLTAASPKAEAPTSRKQSSSL